MSAVRAWSQAYPRIVAAHRDWYAAERRARASGLRSDKEAAGRAFARFYRAGRGAERLTLAARRGQLVRYCYDCPGGRAVFPNVAHVCREPERYPRAFVSGFGGRRDT